MKAAVAGRSADHHVEDVPVEKGDMGLETQMICSRFSLAKGECYRVAYAVGSNRSRRLSRSISVFSGVSRKRAWSGALVDCLDFTLPHGREVSLLPSQVIDVRPSTQNERGQWVLQENGGRARRRMAVPPMTLVPDSSWAHLVEGGASLRG